MVHVFNFNYSWNTESLQTQRCNHEVLEQAIIAALNNAGYSDTRILTSNSNSIPFPSALYYEKVYEYVAENRKITLIFGMEEKASHSTARDSLMFLAERLSSLLLQRLVGILVSEHPRHKYTRNRFLTSEQLHKRLERRGLDVSILFGEKDAPLFLCIDVQNRF